MVLGLTPLVEVDGLASSTARSVLPSASRRPGRNRKAFRAPTTATLAPTMQAILRPAPKPEKAAARRIGWDTAGARPTTVKAAAIDWWAACLAAGGMG